MTERQRTDAQAQPSAGVRRRDVLAGAAGVGVGAVATLGAAAAVRAATAESAEFGRSRTIAAGRHQAGLDRPRAHAVFIGVDLAPDVDRDRIRSLLKILSDDAHRLMAGTAPVGDQEPSMAEIPANLAITFGFGPGLVDRVDPSRKPEWLAPLPKFSIDRLEDRWSHGDLLILVAGDDPLTVAHAQRMMLKDVRAYSTIRWQQTGFRNAHRSLPENTTQRNLFGQLDGTVNAAPDSDEYDRLMWITSDTGPSWLVDGTSFVLRRIHMNLETWDEVDLPGREASVGRRLDTGAPLTGVNEHDEPDFNARTSLGFTVINPMSHIRRARPDDPNIRIVRHTYNYDHPVSGVGGMGAEVSDSGLLFGSLQADPLKQFVPIQQRLDEGDLLNTWTVPVGSAVFAIPPAATAGGFIGDTLFET